jgi:predicted GNAT superfamily acetyltransferase
MDDAPAIEIRDLTDLDDLREVIALEKHVWGYADGEEAIPLPMLAAGILRGAIVLGAFDGGALVAASYSFPALKDGRATHWSHMLGVLEPYRYRGVGRLVKLRQRERALDLGIDLIEWTFDPLQAANGYFNLVRLGAVVEDYEVNVYGESSSPLWQSTESDRFIAQWNLREPHVERRLARRGPIMRASDTLAAACVLEATCVGNHIAPREPDLDDDSRRLRVEIPASFAAIQAEQPALAAQWRAATRAVFTTYLPRGYRIVDFWFDRARACGSYLLASTASAPRDAA